MYLLGFDSGSSSIKASLINIETGKCVASAYSPKQEMAIKAIKPGWAEQDPEIWWEHLKNALIEVLNKVSINKDEIKAIGISYQMHGLVLIDKNKKVLRPSIIWCDSRAVEIGNKALNEIGKEKCLKSLLNSPGNFTASKLKWVQENEPEIYEKIYKIMLPGDYIAMRMTGEINTTITGLSEGIFWDFEKDKISDDILKYYNFNKDFIPDIVPVFSIQGKLTKEAAEELNLVPGIPVSYRAGDQPNNALSLNVLNPGEIAATAGTSGVVYGVSDQIKYDPLSRVNTFAHVNHSKNSPRLGVLLCLNGTGILNSWIKRNIARNIDYDEINNLAATINEGSDGLFIYPFGNGAERMLENKNLGCIIKNINFNIHTNNHIYRAAQEGIVFALYYGIEIMKQTGIEPSIIRAGHANMFLSPIFRTTFANLTGATIELYNTDGAQGAARGAGIGCGIYKNFDDAFKGLEKILTIEPDLNKSNSIKEIYNNWKLELNNFLR